MNALTSHWSFSKAYNYNSLIKSVLLDFQNHQVAIVTVTKKRFENITGCQVLQNKNSLASSDCLHLKCSNVKICSGVLRLHFLWVHLYITSWGIGFSEVFYFSITINFTLIKQMYKGQVPAFVLFVDRNKKGAKPVLNPSFFIYIIKKSCRG